MVGSSQRISHRHAAPRSLIDHRKSRTSRIEGFEKRILYNAAKIYSTQLGSGDSYTLLNPVIALTLTDFVMFEPLDGYLSRFVLKEKTYLLDYPLYDIELVFIELPKFKRPLEQLTTRAEQWLYFIQHARDLSAVPDSLGQAAPLRQAFDLAAEFNLSPEEIDDLERQEIFIHNQRNAIIKAEKQGLKQGLQQGLQQGQIEVLRRLLQRRFNEVPPWVETRLNAASKADLETWIDRVLDAESLTAVFG